MRKLKVIGLSAIAVLAVSAVSASGASAAEGTAVVGGGPAGYTATQTGGGHTFTLPGGRVLSCTTATFTGTVANGDKTVNATPTYDNCSAKIGATTLPATVEPTGCTYKFYDLTTSGEKYAATTDVVCPAGQSIHIKLYSNEANHKAGTRLCEYTVNPQTGLSGVTFTDNANNTLNITATEVSVGLTRTFGIEATCGTATSTSKYNGDTIATPGGAATIDLDD